MSHKIAVIGSNSFSGAHFVNHMMGLDCEVVGISRSKEPADVFLPYKCFDSKYFRFYQMNINTHLQDMLNVLNAFKPEYIVNFAALGMVAESLNYPYDYFKTNASSMIMFHDALRHRSYLKKYVQISTPEVYGSLNAYVTENCTYHPSTPYAVSRAACDMSLMGFYENYGFPVVFTRAANVYGPFQQLYRVIPKAIFCFLKGRSFPLHGLGDSMRSFIHINDVVEGTKRVLFKEKNGDIFHFATNRVITIKGLIRMIAEIMNVPFEQSIETVRDRPSKDQGYFLDSQKAREELEWSDLILLENGIETVISWVKENMEFLERLPLDYIHKP